MSKPDVYTEKCSRCENPREGRHKTCSRCRKGECVERGGAEMEWDNTLPAVPPVIDVDGGEPTEHRPGTIDKVAVMSERYSRGLPLFLPEDSEGAEAIIFGKHGRHEFRTI